MSEENEKMMTQVPRPSSQPIPYTIKCFQRADMVEPEKITLKLSIEELRSVVEAWENGCTCEFKQLGLDGPIVVIQGSQ